MWPFTSRRIFANRWWALGFVAFVCWQVAEVFGQPAAQVGNAVTVAEKRGDQLDEAQLQAIADSLNNIRADE